MKNRNRLALAATAACAFWLAGASVVFAQRPAMTERGYREMRRLAQWLDATAQHAADQARHQDSWVYRHDNRFPLAVDDFARRADRLNERMAGYRAEPWNVDDELRSLLRSAQNVQALARRSREADEHTLSDWNDTVAVLNRMVRLYDFDVRRAGRYDWNAPIPENPAGARWDQGYRHDDDRNAQAYRDQYGSPAPQGNPPPRAYAAPQDGRRARLADLAAELDQHATRAHEMAEGLAGAQEGWRHRYFETIHQFNDQARDFSQRASSGDSDYRELRDQAQQLLNDARRADSDMRRNNAFPEVWQEWQAAMQTLQRILEALRV